MDDGCEHPCVGLDLNSTQAGSQHTGLISLEGHRASELLSITVGTQSISPFYWAIDSGALTAVCGTRSASHSLPWTFEFQGLC